MAKRGSALREHILWTAKDVFMLTGFERASMDAVAAAADTSKRSLYAHFASKEKLFLEVIEFVRGLFLARVKTPASYGEEPAEALVQFCGRYLEILIYRGSIQLCRVCMAEADRFPEGAANHYDVMVTEVAARLRAYLQEAFGLSPEASARAAQALLGDILFPRFPRALFGVDPLAPSFGEEAIAPSFDLAPVRQAVARLLASLPTPAKRAQKKAPPR